MAIEIKVAERGQSKLRIGLSSPSGGGKTYSALLLAKGLVGDWEKIGLIDSENGRGSFYANFGRYNVINLRPPYTPESYIEAIRAFEAAGMEAIIVDSTTHEWDGEGGCLQLNELLAIAKYRGNTWSAWSETTPRHQKFLDALTTSPAHIIATVRNKIETVLADGKVKKVGIKDIQREGFEYELTVNFNIDRDSHMVTASKDNTELFEGKDPFVITEETGKTLKNWMLSGKADETAEEKDELRKKIREHVKTLKQKDEWLEKNGGNINVMTVQELRNLEKKLQATVTKHAKPKEPTSV